MIGNQFCLHLILVLHLCLSRLFNFAGIKSIFLQLRNWFVKWSFIQFGIFFQVIYYSSYSCKTCFIAFCIISFLDNTNRKDKLNQDSAFLIDSFDTAMDLWLAIFHLGIKEYRKHIFPSHIFSKEKGCGKMR